MTIMPVINVSQDESISDGTRRDALILVSDAWSLCVLWCWLRADISSYRLLPEGRQPQHDHRSWSGVLSFITLIASFSGTISYLVFHQKFHFFTLRIRRASSVLLHYFGQSYEFSGAHMGEFKPTLIHPKRCVWYATHSPSFLLPLFFPTPSACSFLLGRAASTPSSSHSPSKNFPTRVIRRRRS